MNPLKWMQHTLFRRQRQILDDLGMVDRKVTELSARLQPIASRMHVIEFEAYGGLRPKPREDGAGHADTGAEPSD